MAPYYDHKVPSSIIKIITHNYLDQYDWSNWGLGLDKMVAASLKYVPMGSVGNWSLFQLKRLDEQATGRCQGLPCSIYKTKPSSAPPVIYEFNLWVRLKTKHVC